MNDINQVYVQGTKKAANESLAKGKRISARWYKLFDQGHMSLQDCNVGTVVKFYKKFVGNSPYATAYGVMAKKKDGALYVK